MPFCGLNRPQYGNSLAWFRVLGKIIGILTCQLHDFHQVIFKKIWKMFIDSYILAFVILHFFLVIFQCKIELWGILLIDNLHILYIFFIWTFYFDQFKRIQSLIVVSLVWFSPASLRTELFTPDLPESTKRGKCSLKVLYAWCTILIVLGINAWNVYVATVSGILYECHIM